MSKARDLADLISTGGILADGAVSVSEISDLTATAAELNTLDGITASVTELNTLDGITASTADLNNVTNINTNVQTQLDLKAPLASPTFTGTVNVDGVAQIRGVTVEDSSGTTKGYVQGDADGLLIASDGSNNITFDVNASERMRIDSSGNVGIGTTSPTGKLTVDNGSIHLGNNGEGIVFGSDTNTNNAIYGNATSNFIALQTNGSERFRIGSTGELGIGGATYGTSGQVLTSGGSGAAPTWADVATGGALFNGNLFQ